MRTQRTRGRHVGERGPAIADAPAAHSPRGQTWIKRCTRIDPMQWSVPQRGHMRPCTVGHCRSKTVRASPGHSRLTPAPCQKSRPKPLGSPDTDTQFGPARDLNLNRPNVVPPPTTVAHVHIVHPHIGMDATRRDATQGGRRHIFMH